LIFYPCIKMRQSRSVSKENTMVWTMWQGWHDENQKNLRLERELARLRNTLNRVVDERDGLKTECDKLKEERNELQEENKKLRNS
jgi:hypothetical protein